ncbi:hypothetical protein RQP46_006482 [Phenoliferia psychrophenolica]
MASQVELIQDATHGFELLLNNRIDESRALFLATNSPYHLLGKGLAGFLSAALGQESGELAGALEVLVEAETSAAAAKRAKTEPPTVFPAGTEHKILVADAVIAQSLCHILTESYLEFMKIVFPAGVAADESLTSIFTKLNAAYLKAKTESPSKSSTSATASLLSWGSSKKRMSDASSLRHSASTSALPSSLLPSAPGEDVAATAPASRNGSRQSSLGAETSLGVLDENGAPIPEPLWAGDALTTLVISGAAFGFGLFSLIFSLLTRKLISWFGFSNSNRTVALKLLTVASSTGDDVHGYFASLSLVSYYSIILLMSGWQAEEEYLIQQTSDVLARVSAKFPDGTLWVLNRAKLMRMKNDVDSAIKTIEHALAQGSSFREADSLLVFELSWCYLSDARWEAAAASFIRMRELNSWSHATYLLMAAGSLLELAPADRSPEVTTQINALLDELPALFGQKRLLGEPPSTEIFIARKLEVYKRKHLRLVASGQLPPESKYSEAIRISPASEVRLLPSHGPLILKAHDLDTSDELAIRALLLGTLYRSLGSYKDARAYLEAVIEAAAVVVEEKWIVAFANLELAVLECQEADLEGKKLEAGGDVYSLPEYDLKGRLEGRAGMLRDQLGERKTKLGI